jgi:HEPN domain-containing protein
MAEKSLVADWLRHANNDLITAKHMYDDVYPKQKEISAFHSQQCAEKALKAFLYANEIPFPWIHDLVKLVRLCKDVDQSFSEIEIECGRLNPYSTITRYPNEIMLDDNIVTAVIERAQKVLDFCTAKVNLK